MWRLHICWVGRLCFIGNQDNSSTTENIGFNWQPVVMDPSKKIGKIKEQVTNEQKARGNYQKYWSKLSDGDLNKFYNPNKLNEIIEEEDAKRSNSYRHNNTGDGGASVFPEMYKSLGTCRCGRPRHGVHMTKCLQKAENKYLLEAQKYAEPIKPLPRTSNGFIGWQARQKLASLEWERSTKYVSPVSTMIGPRITATPYNAVIIG